MNNIRLYLYDRFGNDATKEYEVELDSSIQFAITKQFTDLENPTTIINDWSKSIAIPFTKHNNEIFNYLYRSDRAVISNEPVGAFGFDPTKKIPFRLINDENVLMTGYVKVLSVEQTSSVEGKYNITLNGELGKIFQEMKNITFNNAESEEDYYIDGKQYVEETMNRDLIKTCWTTDGQSTMELKKRTDPDYKVTDIIGFAPNNAFSENFDYKSFESTDNEFKKFSTHLQEHWDSVAPNIGIEAETAIPDGVTPRGIGEYRSYLQIPYIYWNKLFGIFREKAEELTGYEFDLDEDWFNEANPYWRDLVYCLDKPTKKERGLIFNIYDVDTDPNQAIYYPGLYGDTDNPQERGYIATDSTEMFPIWNATTKTFDFGNETYYIDNENTYDEITISGYSDHRYIQSGGGIVVNALLLDYEFIDTATNEAIKTLKYFLTIAPKNIDWGTPIPPGYERIYDYTLSWVELEPNVYNDFYKFKINIGSQLTAFGTDFIGKNVSVNIKTRWFLNSYMVSPFYSIIMPHQSQVRVCPERNISINVKGHWRLYNIPSDDIYIKSFMKFTLNELWNNEYSLFQQILNYCKMFHICIVADEYNKKIKFVPFDKFLRNNLTIEDWSNKVDYSKQWKLENNIVDSKYLLFNYDDSQTFLRKSYKDSNGINYGEIKVDRNYAFDNNTKTMFEKIKNSNVLEQYVMSWYNLYDLALVEYTYDDELFIDNADDKNKEISSFGEFYFYNGLTYFKQGGESETHLRNVEITDDTEKQINTMTYMYNQTKNPYEVIETYPKLSIFKKRWNDETSSLYYVSLFNTPKTIYASFEISESINIYNAFWVNYINDLYSVGTKKITCYIRLSNEDFNNFDFSHFVTINNQLFMVNKIYDFNISQNVSTKVELISINNINNYITSNFDLWDVLPREQTYEGSEFIGHTFIYTLFDYQKLDLSEYEFTMLYRMPDNWTKEITTELIDENRAKIKVKIESPLVVQSAGDYDVTLNVKKTTTNESLQVKGIINIIRDTDMAQEMTE